MFSRIFISYIHVVQLIGLLIGKFEGEDNQNDRLSNWIWGGLRQACCVLHFCINEKIKTKPIEVHSLISLSHTYRNDKNWPTGFIKPVCYITKMTVGKENGREDEMGETCQQNVGNRKQKGWNGLAERRKLKPKSLKGSKPIKIKHLQKNRPWKDSELGGISKGAE